MLQCQVVAHNLVSQLGVNVDRGVHCASQWFMEQNAMPALVRLLHDSDSTVRQKGLMSLSCLLRHNQRGLTAFAQVQTHPHLLQLTIALHFEMV